MKGKSKPKRTTAEQRRLAKGIFSNESVHTLATVISRTMLAARLGKSYDGDRDLYTALGYKSTLDFADFLGRYKRQEIAKAVINKPVSASWRTMPDVYESNDDEETPFEKGWQELVKRLKLKSRFARLDRLASIGSYAVLLLGFGDNNGGNLSKPVEKAKKLLFVTPYSENAAKVKTYENSTNSPRYGMPTSYTISIGQGDTKNTPVEVHYTRVLHVSPESLEDDLTGTPALEAIWNRLQDLETISGGSSEMFWRGAFPGLSFEKDPDATIPDETKVVTEIENYIHKISRYLLLEGVKANQLTAQVADPSGHFNLLISLISAGTGIPQRILMGSEMGKLASTEDQENWNAILDARRTDHCSALIVRPFIDRCIDVGVLPEPKDGPDEYIDEWPDPNAMSDKDRADVGKTIAEGLAAYENAVGARDDVPPEVMLPKLGFTPDEMELIDEYKKEIDKTNAVEPPPTDDQPPAPGDQPPTDQPSADQGGTE